MCVINMGELSKKTIKYKHNINNAVPLDIILTEPYSDIDLEG